MWRWHASEELARVCEATGTGRVRDLATGLGWIAWRPKWLRQVDDSAAGHAHGYLDQVSKRDTRRQQTKRQGRQNEANRAREENSSGGQKVGHR
jgi:hypothetical protein